MYFEPKNINMQINQRVPTEEEIKSAFKFIEE